MDQHITFITEFGEDEADAIACEVTRNESHCLYKAGRGLASCFDNDLMSEGGLTVGQVNRAHLHRLLDEWLDAQIEDQSIGKTYIQIIK